MTRVLILSDIHANWSALSALNEPHDLCICLGDLVDYGPDPKPCVDWVRQHGSIVVRGNHDHAVAQGVIQPATQGYRLLAMATREYAWADLSVADLQFLGRLPTRQWVTVDGQRLALAHAAWLDPLDDYIGDEPDVWRRQTEGLDADWLFVGHTHQPFVRRLDHITVVNVGSVGQSRDGDPRGCYCVWDNGQIELKRFDYSTAVTLQRLRDRQLPADALCFATTVLQHGRAYLRRPQPTPKLHTQLQALATNSDPDPSDPDAR